MNFDMKYMEMIINMYRYFNLKSLKITDLTFVRIVHI